MGIRDFKDYKLLIAAGSRMGRAGMSERVSEAVADWQKEGGYKAAMILAGRLKAIAVMANADEYWKEQVQKGFAKELTHAAKEE